MKGEHTGAKTCRETLATFHLFPLTRQWSFLSFSPQPLLPLFFKVGPIGRSTEFSKDETTGVIERGGEKRGRKERGGELGSAWDSALLGRRRKEGAERGIALPLAQDVLDCPEAPAHCLRGSKRRGHKLGE